MKTLPCNLLIMVDMDGWPITAAPVPNLSPLSASLERLQNYPSSQTPLEVGMVMWYRPGHWDAQRSADKVLGDMGVTFSELTLPCTFFLPWVGCHTWGWGSLLASLGERCSHGCQTRALKWLTHQTEISHYLLTSFLVCEELNVLLI